MIMKATCVRCSAEIPPERRRKTTKYCSHRCRQAAWKAKAEPAEVEATEDAPTVRVIGLDPEPVGLDRQDGVDPDDESPTLHAVGDLRSALEDGPNEALEALTRKLADALDALPVSLWADRGVRLVAEYRYALKQLGGGSSAPKQSGGLARLRAARAATDKANGWI
jgi:hypothetical protein